MKANRLAFGGLLVVLITATCCSTCFLMFAGDAARRHFRYWAAKPVYQEKLGVSNSDDELEAFMTEELKGLTREEVIEKLGEWGDVEVRECLNVDTHGWCVIQVSNFLETGQGHEFTIIFEFKSRFGYDSLFLILEHIDRICPLGARRS